jgi:hypothetical protein
MSSAPGTALLSKGRGLREALRDKLYARIQHRPPRRRSGTEPLNGPVRTRRLRSVTFTPSGPRP